MTVSSFWVLNGSQLTGPLHAWTLFAMLCVSWIDNKRHIFGWLEWTLHLLDSCNMDIYLTWGDYEVFGKVFLGVEISSLPMWDWCLQRSKAISMLGIIRISHLLGSLLLLGTLFKLHMYIMSLDVSLIRLNFNLRIFCSLICGPSTMETGGFLWSHGMCVLRPKMSEGFDWLMLPLREIFLWTSEWWDV